MRQPAQVVQVCAVEAGTIEAEACTVHVRVASRHQVVAIVVFAGSCVWKDTYRLQTGLCTVTQAYKKLTLSEYECPIENECTISCTTADDIM